MPKDLQHEFYEIGYAGPALPAQLIIESFERLPRSSRIARAAMLVADDHGHFLDIGCGSGPLLYRLRNRFDKLTGVDIAEAQLDRVRSWIASTGAPVQLYRCNLDLEPLPMSDCSVDVTACMVVLELALRPEFVVSEIARVLRPNGVLICSIGNIVSWRNRIRVLFGSDPRTTTFMNAINGGALHHFTRATFVALLEESGLVVETIGCSGRWWQLRSLWPSLLGGDILVLARKPA